jgi:hypothetical protein
MDIVCPSCSGSNTNEQCNCKGLYSLLRRMFDRDNILDDFNKHHRDSPHYNALIAEFFKLYYQKMTTFSTKYHDSEYEILLDHVSKGIIEFKETLINE